MIAPFAASIQNVDVFRSTSTLLTRPSRTTPVKAPTIRPRPPSSSMPPITAAANTVKIRLLPWFAVTATTWPAIFTEAEPGAALAPIVERALRWFGAERCLFGSDWPVCLLTTVYGSALELVRSTVGDADRDAVLARTAIRTYGLDASFRPT